MTEKQIQEEEIQVKVCLSCFLVYRHDLTSCPSCGSSGAMEDDPCDRCKHYCEHTLKCVSPDVLDGAEECEFYLDSGFHVGGCEIEEY